MDRRGWAAGDLSAIGHLAGAAAASIVEGIRVVTVSTSGKGLPPWASSSPEVVGQIDRVLTNVALLFEPGCDIDRGIGNDNGLVVSGNGHHKGVADAA